MREAGPRWREGIAGIGLVVAWGLAGAGARGSPVEAATWTLAGYLAAAAFFLLGVLPEVGVRDAPREKPSRRWWAFVLGVAVLARLAVLPLTPSDDTSRYVVEGKLVLHGENPYVVAPVDPRLDSIRDERFARVNHPDLPAIYPPLATFVSALVSALWADERAWKLVGLACDLVALAALAATIRRRGEHPRRLLLYAWNPVVIYALAGRGHNDGLLVVLLAVALWAEARGRAAWAGIALAGATLAKLSACVIAPVVLPKLGRRPLVAFATTLALSLAPLALAGGDPSRSLRAFLGEMRANDSVHFVVYELLRGGGRTNAAASQLASVVSCALLAGIVTAAAVAVRRRKADALAASAAVMAGALLVAPTVHVWYLTWPVVLLPFARSVRPALAIWSATIGLSLVVEVEQARTGTWCEPAWVRAPEYAPVIAALVWGIFRGATARVRAPANVPVLATNE